MGRTLQKIDHALDELQDMPEEMRDYFQSGDGIEHLMRRLSDAFNDWRQCPVRRCRRARGCQGPDMICQLGEGPRFHAPQAEIAHANARMRRVVEGWLERFGIV